MQKEIWRDVPTWEGYYQVSSRGRVKSISRVVVNVNGLHIVLRGRLMRSNKTSGYLRLILSRRGKTKAYNIHTLVAMAFLGHVPCGRGIVVDHIDGDKSNNNLSNLEVVTNRENTSRAFFKSKESGLPTGVNRSGSRYCSYIEINGLHIYLGMFDTAKEASDKYIESVMLTEKGLPIMPNKRKNTHGYKGVYFCNNRYWKATIGVNGEKHTLGYFHKIDDAINVRKEAERLVSIGEDVNLCKRVNIRHKGVSYLNGSGKWRAYYSYKGVYNHIGLYYSIDEAISARVKYMDTILD